MVFFFYNVIKNNIMEGNFIDILFSWLQRNHPECVADFKSAVNIEIDRPEFYCPKAHHWLSKNPKIKREFEERYRYANAFRNKIRK